MLATKSSIDSPLPNSPSSADFLIKSSPDTAIKNELCKDFSPFTTIRHLA